MSLRRISSWCVALAVAMLTAGCGASRAPETAAPPADRAVASWPTWVLRSPADVAPPPPGTGALGARRRDGLAHLPPRQAARIVRRWTERPATAPWTELNLALVSHRPVDPPRAARGYALVSVAMYDAVVAARYWDGRYSAARTTRGGYPSEDASVAGAASRVLAYLFPDHARADLDRIAEQAADAEVRAGASSRDAVDAGLAVGRSVASAVIARARADGSSRPWHGHLPHDNELWRPTPGSSEPPSEPLAGTWRTWILRSGDEFRPPPPPALRSPQFASAAREVVAFRRRLTFAQKRIAKFWEGGVGTPLPPGVWNEVALAYARRDRLTTAQAARVFALMNVAMADTAVATWDAKYAYWTPRPETAIRDLGIDRHWRPFLGTPPFPSYVSAHSSFSGAASEVLATLFPRDAAAFRAKAVDAGMSRLYGGIHYRFDHDAGLALGRRIGQLVIERARSANARNEGSGGHTRSPR
jgi:membrane-associated phospholipid phosphatase